MPARLAHVLIFAADREILAAFYAAVLAWPRVDRGAGFTIVGAPAAGIAVHQVPPHILTPPPPDAPLTWCEDAAHKPCIEVDDLDATCAAIVAHGGAVRAPWTWEGGRYVECADPEGNVFQVFTCAPG